MNDRRELALFLSSTFLDMGPEREHLVKQVFPELRQICRERGVTLTEIDLRWGITERQARRGKIVTACLDEILQRRPFILAFIGDRYGWCPASTDLNDSVLLSQFPWIEAGVKDGKSLVELETLEVARHDSGLREQIWFYFKKKVSPSSAGNGSEDNEQRRLRDFHKRVRESGLPLREGYRTPAQLGEWIREDVLAILETIAPEGSGLESWITRERLGHEAYAVTRRRAYIDHQPTLDLLDEHVQSENIVDASSVDSASSSHPFRSLPLVITGESGAGKSALLARWSARYRRQFPDAFMVEHYVGATPSSADRFALMRRVMSEIRERYSLKDELPASPELIAEAFPTWLARVRDEKLILVIDAFDRLDNAQTALSAFPHDYPAHIRILLSTTPGPVLAQTKERNWRSVKLASLGAEDRSRAIRAYLAEFSKQLEPEQVRRIARDDKSANPLYLRTSLEELRLHGTHETLNGRIEHYLSAPDPRALFGLVLERIENDYGKGLTATAMSSIWASRSGLSETELCGILNVSPIKLRPLIRGMEYHLTHIDGRLNFCHDHLRESVRERYLPSRVRRRNFHRRIGEWFSQQPITPRRAEEEPWQWKEGEEWGRLEGCLVNMEMFLLLLRDRDRMPMLEYWRLTSLQKGFIQRAEEVYRKGVLSITNARDRVLMLCTIGELFLLLGLAGESVRLYRRTAKLLGDLPDSLRVKLFDAMGAAYIASGDYYNASECLQQSIDMKGRLFDTQSNETADTREQFGHLLYQMRRFTEAEQAFTLVMDIRKVTLGSSHPLTMGVLSGLAAACSGQRKFEKAINLLKRYLAFLRSTHEDRTAEGATCLNNLGAVLSQQEDYEAAVQYQRRALDLYEELYGTHHPQTAKAMANLSHSLHFLNRLEEAKPLLLHAIDFDTKIYGDNHPATATKYINLGTMLREMGDAVEAEKMYRKALAIRESRFGSDHIATVIAWVNIAGALKDQNRLRESYELYEEFLPSKMSALPADDPGLQRSLLQFHELKAIIEDQGVV